MFSPQHVEVLFISDGRETRAQVPSALDGAEQFAVETATSATEGVERIGNDPPDCVVSEYELADTNGVDFLRRLREEFPEIPFVLYPAEGSEAVASEAISAGVTEYVRQSESEHGRLRERIRDAVRGQRQTRQADRRAELTRLTEGLDDAGCFEIDFDADEMLMTEGARELTGFDEGTEPSLDDVLALHPPDDRQEVRQSINRAVRTGERTRGVWEYCSLDGEERTAELTFISVETTGDATMLRGIINDITERKERERELEQIETLFEHAQDGLFLVDVGEEFTIERVNSAYEEMAGVSAAEVRGRTPTEALGEQQGTAVKELYRECIERREPLEYSDEIRFGGEMTHWEMKIAPVVIDGTVEYIAGSTQNVTERKERQQELQRLQQAVDGANVGITVSDPTREDNPLVYVNDAFEELTGYSAEEILGRNCRFLQGEGTDPERVADLRTAIDSEEPVTVELRNYRADGTEFWNRLTVTPIYDEDGTLVRYIGTQEDITERKERERELGEQRRFIEQALDALDDLFYVLDLDGSISRWNERLPEITGYDESELDAMQAIELFPDDERETIADGIETALTEGRDTVEADIFTADDERVPYEFTGARLTDLDGTTTGVVGIGRDLTEHRERERRFRALVEESSDVITIVDDDGQIQYESPTVGRILGYEPAEMTGDMAWQYIHPDDIERVATEFQEWIADPETARKVIQFRVRHADGSWRWLEARGNNHIDSSAVGGYVITSRDITDRKKREKQLDLLDRVLRHNLRNDLNVIQGRAERIRLQSSAEIASDADQIVDVTERLMRMAENEREITDLLREEPEYSEVSLRPLLGRVVSAIASEYPDATLAIDCPENVTVRATKRLGEAIDELVTNAVVHNDSRSPEVTVSVTQSGAATTIEVADNGPLIPEMERDVLVEQGEQTPLHHGSGLGLWLVSLIVSRSGGTIAFEKNSPTGNVVRVELPD